MAEAPLLQLTFRDVLRIEVALEVQIQHTTSHRVMEEAENLLNRVRTIITTMETPRPGRTELPALGIVETTRGPDHG